MNSDQFGSSIKDRTNVYQRDIDPVDISVAVIARKRLISEINETEKLFKCDLCDFSTKHEQNLRVHQEWLIIVLKIYFIQTS